MSGDGRRPTKYSAGPQPQQPARAQAALAELHAVGVDVARIVARGEQAFFDPDDATQRMAAAFAIIRFGEAAKQLPEQTREQYPQIPWRAIIGARDIAAHYVGSFDFAFTWESVTREIPEVLAQLPDSVQ